MKRLRPNPMRKANIFSLLTFWWLNDHFRDGSKRPLEVTDMFELDHGDKSEEISKRLTKNWTKELNEEKKPSLNRAIATTYMREFIIIACLTFIKEAFRMVLPILISQLIKHFENRDNVPVSHAYAYAAAISVVSFALVIVHHRYFYVAQKIGWHIRVAACDLMFKKTLKLSQKSLNQTTTGQIVNLGATDVIRFDYFPTVINFLWFLPLHIIVVGAVLWQEVGISILAGLGLLIILQTVQTLNGKAFGRIRTKTAILTDNRIRLINEVITGIKIIKMYAWEKSFATLVSESRRKEINKILLSSALRALNVSLFLCTDKMSTFVTLTVYVLLGGNVTASKVFLAVGLISTLKLSSRSYSRAIEALFESLSATERIQNYLLLDEITPTRNDLSCSDYPLVELKDFTAEWQQSYNLKKSIDKKNEETLKNISIEVKDKNLYAIIGPVGTGKSSLLSAILGELPPTKGLLTVEGIIGFANQIPWIFSGTVRENILFGEEYDSVRFGEVIEACCLEKDLASLPGGDLAIVGERGVTLSGGQKSRVSLARAAYRKNTDIILMDDPLSAVDPSVAHHIFNNCISGMMQNKIRILVTHQLQLLRHVDQIIVLRNGRITDRGTYEDLKLRVADFDYLKQRENKPGSNLAIRYDEESSESIVSNATLKQDTLQNMTRSVESVNSMEDGDLNVGQVVPAEEREKGNVELKAYLEYFREGSNYFTLGIFILVIILSHVLFVMNDWWLARWVVAYEYHTTHQENATLSKSGQRNIELRNVTASYLLSSSLETNKTRKLLESELENFDSSYYLKTYTAIHVAMILVILLRTNMHFYLCVTSGIHMHKKMFEAILRAPVRFFDITPVGRILNRFSKDTGQVDELLPFTFIDFLFLFGDGISMIILTSVINYFVILFLIPMTVCFLWLRNYYLQTSRELKRLEGSCRSPVFSLLSSALEGLVTIRAFGAQKQFESNFQEKQDLHSATWFLFIAGSRWFGMRLDLITTAFITSVTFLCVIAASFLNLNSGDIGIILTYSVSMISMFQYGVRQSTEVENLMTSVERIQEYYRLLPEAPYEIPGTKPHSEWPSHGAISLKNLSFTHYTNGQTVLHNISAEIQPKEKIGLVGRTGAGKSSLIAAMFRFSELAGGEIYIDGVPISSLGLWDLRNAVSVIPQDPVLFSGTMRKNLDPFTNYADEDLWDALDQVQLKGVVEALPLKLNTELAESGSNFSVGQRQLVCLARAILRKSKILIIDEATANVDLRTDCLIQVTIGEKFKHCTVVTVAHRINTIIDSDKIMVLDSGYLKEFDKPHLLLQNPDGYFYKMVKSTGRSESHALQQRAQEVYIAKHQDKDACEDILGNNPDGDTTLRKIIAKLDDEDTEC